MVGVAVASDEVAGAGPGPDPARRRGAAVAGRVCDLVVALLAAAVAAYGVRITGGAYFWADEWRLIDQAGDLGGFVEAYNDHLSVVILGTYRLLVDLFGFDHLPVRVVGFAWLVAVPVTWYLATRSRLGPPLAALGALALLALDDLGTYPGQQNHYQALVAGIVCAWALERGRRADAVVAGSLAFSLASAGGGVAVAAAAVVHSLVTRAPSRRWVAVLLPTAAWTAWWLFVAERSDQLVTPSTSARARFVVELLWGSVRSPVGGNRVLGAAVAAAFLVVAARTLRRGLTASANLLAWSAATLAWAVGLALNRGLFATPEQFRYRYVAVGLLLLAVVPRRPLAWRRLLADRRRALAATVAVVAAGLVVGVVAHQNLADDVGRRDRAWRNARGTAMVLAAEPAVVPDGAPGIWAIGQLPAGRVRALYDRYDPDERVGRDDLDRRLVEVGVVRAWGRGRRDGPCRPLGGPLALRPDAGEVHLRAEEPGVRVEVRRFGEDWVPVRTPPAARAVVVWLPPLGVEDGWELRAPGACRLVNP